MYERMEYAHERRDWVRYADEKLPALRLQASRAQQEAATLFAYWDSVAFEHRPGFGQLGQMVSDAYAYAHMLLLRVIHYEGMRRANLETEE